MKKLYLLMISTLLLTGCVTDTWTGFFYADANDLTKFITEAPFDTSEECLEWIDSQAVQVTRGDYHWKCGKNCEKAAVLEGLPFCEETIQE